MSVVDEQPVYSRNIASSGGCGPEIDPRRLQRGVRTSARASLNVAANPWILFTLCLLATIASVEAQAVAAPVILINRNSGQCVTIPNGSSQPGLQMVQLPCRGPLERAMDTASRERRVLSNRLASSMACAWRSPAHPWPTMPRSSSRPAQTAQA